MLWLKEVELECEEKSLLYISIYCGRDRSSNAPTKQLSLIDCRSMHTQNIIFFLNKNLLKSCVYEIEGKMINKKKSILDTCTIAKKSKSNKSNYQSARSSFFLERKWTNG